MQVETRTADVCVVREEWQDVELVELLQSRIQDLEGERARLRTELMIAESWVKELARWIDEAQAGRTEPSVLLVHH